MSTTSTSVSSMPRQLVFSFGNAASFSNEVSLAPTVPTANRHVQLGVPAASHVVSESSQFVPVGTAVGAGRRGKVEHISDLLVAVLARYGIDADEFLAEMEQG